MKKNVPRGKGSLGVVFRLALLVPVLAVLLGSGDNGLAAGPSTVKPSAASNDFDALAKDIKREVVGLGYSDKVAQDFVEMVRAWDLAGVKQKLLEAREGCRRGRLSKDQVARAEGDAAETLIGKVREKIGSSDDDFDLADVVKDREANCLGEAQLFYLLGSSVGLSVKSVLVYEPAWGHFPLWIAHAASLVDLADGRAVMVDANGFGPARDIGSSRFFLDFAPVSRPFVFAETFAAKGNYCENKSKSNPLELYRRIQVTDRTGLLATIHCNRGARDTDNGGVDKALAEFSEAIRLNPKLAWAFWNRGLAYHQEGDYQRAIADCTEAIRLNPRQREAYVVRSWAHCHKADYDKAIADCSEAIRLAPGNDEAYYARGWAYGRKGDYDKAVADLTQAIRLDPKYAWAYRERGWNYLQKGDLDMAIVDYSEAIRLKPKLAEAYYGRGWAYGEKGDLDKDIADRTEAIRLNPKNAVAYYGRGLAYAKKRALDKAIADYSEAIRLKPKLAEAYYGRGWAYGEKGDLDKDIADCTEAIRLNPKNAVAYCGRGCAYAEKRTLDKAIADYSEAIRLDPKDAKAYYNRGWAYGEEGDFDKEIADCTEAIRLDPTFGMAYSNRGWAYYEKGDFDKAVANYAEAAADLVRALVITAGGKLAAAYHAHGETYALLAVGFALLGVGLSRARRGLRQEARESQGRTGLRPGQEARLQVACDRGREPLPVVSGGTVFRA